MVTQHNKKRSASAPLALRQQTPAWVDARRDYIGSSDLPIITGNTPYTTSAWSLWAIKTRLAEPEPVDEDTLELWDIGHLLEDDIAERYTVQTGRPLRRANRMLVRRDLPWASANLDRVSSRRGERRIVEIKWLPRRHWAVEGPEPVPAYVQDQVQWQLYVTGWDAADVAVLDGSHVHVYEGIGPSDKYQDDLLYLARDFRDHVVRGTPPPVDGSEATRRAIARLYPRPSLGIMPATLETDALAGDLRRTIAERKDAEQREGTLRNTLRLVLAEYAGVEGEGYRISHTKNAGSQVTHWDKVAAGYRRLLEAIGDALAREQLAKLTVGESDLAALALVEGAEQVTLPELLDTLEALHTEQREGARVLRPWYRGEDGRWT